MPYVPEENRQKITQSNWGLDDIQSLVGKIETAGDLNYTLSRLIYLFYKKGGRYQNINDAMGAMVGSLLEVYMRVYRPYEDKAIERNGDIFDPEDVETFPMGKIKDFIKDELKEIKEELLEMMRRNP